jgi:methionyl-tRNA synthetase
VYWPAFLLAAGYTEAELPSQVFAHGFLTVDGHKMSKSLRNAVNPLGLAREMGADVLRYQLLRAIAFGQDGDFDHAAMIERYNADLGKNLGNLLSRTLGLCAKNTGSKTPDANAKVTDLERDFAARFEGGVAAAAEAWEAIAPHRALEATWELSSAANQYVDRAAPWAAAKSGDTARVETILGTLLTALGALSVMIAPALPVKANEMRAQLGLAALETAHGKDVWPLAFTPRAAGEALPGGPPLFPTLDKDQERALLEKLVPKPAAPVDDAAAAKGPSRAASPSVPPPTVKMVPSETTQLASYEEFARIDLRVGAVLTAEKVKGKDKLLKLSVDVGEAAPRTIIAGLALTFQPEQLVGRRVVVVANLAPRDFGKGLVSFGMLLATGPSEDLKLAAVEGDVKPGDRLK